MQLTIGEARLDVLDEGRGPALVLLHGFPLAKETWDAQAAGLRSDTRVVRLDLRGLGRSGVTPGPYLMESLASDVAGVLDALDIERAVIAGHSLGGYVAFAFYRMFAERCLGLGIVCSRAGADDAAAAAVRNDLASRVEREGMDPVVETFVPRFFAPDVYARQPELVERARALVAATDPRGAAAMLRGMAARVSSEDLLADIDIPVRVIAGAFDALMAALEVRSVAGSVRRGELDVLPCGHFPLYEAPEALAASLRQLVRDAGRFART